MAEYIVEARPSDLFGIKMTGLLVRCKDCIYMEKMDVDIGEGDLIWCSVHEFGREIDYYCADGERGSD